MEAIVSMLESIGNFFASIVEFVIDMVNDIVYVVELTGQTVVSIPGYFSWLPPAASALIVTIFGIVVVYKVLGREG